MLPALRVRMGVLAAHCARPARLHRLERLGRRSGFCLCCLLLEHASVLPVGVQQPAAVVLVQPKRHDEEPVKEVEEGVDKTGRAAVAKQRAAQRQEVVLGVDVGAARANVPQRALPPRLRCRQVVVVPIVRVADHDCDLVAVVEPPGRERVGRRRGRLALTPIERVGDSARVGVDLRVGRNVVGAKHSSLHQQVRAIAGRTGGDEEEDDCEEEEEVPDVLDCAPGVVDEEAEQEAADDADDARDRDGRRRCVANAKQEHNSLHALSKDCEEDKQEHGVV
mmetsp:Transcript_20576/g.61338  ORF Transcript_20576/g.61338 Transcript_20576/m.61338 type:complete len:279 (-) Transcript_20576:845-1681(-)